jgi:hypothetical protein
VLSKNSLHTRCSPSGEMAIPHGPGPTALARASVPIPASSGYAMTSPVSGSRRPIARPQKRVNQLGRGQRASGKRVAREAAYGIGRGLGAEQLVQRSIPKEVVVVGRGLWVERHKGARARGVLSGTGRGHRSRGMHSRLRHPDDTATVIPERAHGLVAVPWQVVGAKDAALRVVGDDPAVVRAFSNQMPSSLAEPDASLAIDDHTLPEDAVLRRRAMAARKRERIRMVGDPSVPGHMC